MKKRSYKKVTSLNRLTMCQIAEFQAKHGYPPTLRELQKLNGLKYNSVARERFDDLWRKGITTHRRGRSRAVQIKLPPTLGKLTLVAVPCVPRSDD